MPKHTTHVSHNPHKSTEIPPAIFPPPAPAGGGTGFNILKADFENGVFNPPLVVVGNPGVSVINDPTARATGKVLDILYQNDVANGNTDANSGLVPAPFGSLQVGLGQGVRFKGDFYIDKDFGANVVQRKLTYWGWSNDSWGFQHPFNLTIKSFDNQIALTQSVVRADGSIFGSFIDVGSGDRNIFFPTATYSLAAKTWHSLDVSILFDSAFGSKDGYLKVAFDTQVLLEKADMQFTSADWPDDPTTYKWVDWRFGQQMDTPIQNTEHRYWDNVVYDTF